MTVMKFGGSCLSSREDIKKTVEIIKSEEIKEEVKDEGRPVIVLSAFKGVTDKLIAESKNALAGSFKTDEIIKLHLDLTEGLSPKTKTAAQKRICELQSELENTLLGVSYLKELSPKTLDKVMSFGERMAVHVISAHLIEEGFESHTLSDSEAGIITDSTYGNATIIDAASRPLMKKKLQAGDSIPVVTGFIGRDEEGFITTLGRGGSDYTASYIASVLGCDAILWKDVAGLMTADPKIVKGARIIEKINYLDALELAHYGSKVIFEKAILPAMKSGITLRIRDFLDTNREGTSIGSEMSKAIAISSVKHAMMVDFYGYSSDMMLTISDLFREFSEHNIYPLLLTEASSCGETSVNESTTRWASLRASRL